MTKRRVTKTDLRKRAEQSVRKRRKSPKLPAKSPSLPESPAKSRLVHELEVHQVELELQNEELRNARLLTEVALERFTEVFDFAPIGYAILDEDGRIRELNHVGAHLLGSERGAFIGKRFLAYVDSRSLVAFATLLSTALARSASAAGELDLSRNASSFSARLTVATLRRSQTTMIAFEDISDRRRQEIELARTEAALREQSRRKMTFWRCCRTSCATRCHRSGRAWQSCSSRRPARTPRRARSASSIGRQHT